MSAEDLIKVSVAAIASSTCIGHEPEVLAEDIGSNKHTEMEATAAPTKAPGSLP